MATPDLLLGLLAGAFLKREPQARRPAEVIVPPAPGPSPAPSPSTGPTTPAVLPPAPTPTFPSEVIVPPAPPSPTPAPEPTTPGFKKAVEVWQVKPELASAGTLLAGLGPQVGAVSLTSMEQTFPNGWQPARVVTQAEVQTAQALLKKWTDGGVIFAGPGTLQGRRAFRMTKHPLRSTAPATPIVPTPTGPTVPANVPPPTPGPTVPANVQPTPPGPPPFVPPSPVSPAPVSPAPASAQVTTIRPGEGLATAAKRMGRAGSAQDASELRNANVPNGPDGQWAAKALTAPEKGIKKKNRRGGLQPGDRLFVPASWGFIDPARL